jgi:hypothetical protein
LNTRNCRTCISKVCKELRATPKGFIDPVIDRADLSLRFNSAQALLTHLKAQGGMLDRQDVRKGLMTPRQYQKLIESLENVLMHELISAHAWRGKSKREDDAQVITLAQLKANLRAAKI